MTKSPRVPFLTLILVAANIFAAFLIYFRPELVDKFAFQPSHFSLLTLVTSLFLHSSALHLLGNMIFLAAVGPPLEFAIGPLKFGVLYLVGGVVGNLAHFAIMGKIAPNDLVIGASGAVAACVGLASVRFFSVRVPLTPKISAAVPALIGVWVVLQGLGAFVKLGDAPGGISYWAHLGGVLAGLLLSMAFRLPKDVQLAFGHDVLDRINHLGPDAQLAVAEKHLRDHPDDLRAQLTVLQSHRDLGNAAEESAGWLKLLDEGAPEEQVLAVTRLAELKMLGEMDSRRRSRIASSLLAENPEAATTLLESIANGSQTDVERPQALLALALKDSKWAKILKQDYPFDPATDVAQKRGLL
ncbi:MAG: rhomboid family intramembrane serine protease [Armatimonadetes bacterium]|nr:rhomboid family intramembrane serine protease [Armatimonadota bacterium]